MQIQLTSIDNSKGIALIIVLIFLLVTTLLGITALRSNVMTEKMTLNAIQREEALEIAEATLLEAEQLIEYSNSQILTELLSNRVPTAEALRCEETLTANGDPGLCVKIEASPGYDGTAYDHWRDIKDDDNSINVWTNENRHRTLDNPALMNAYNITNPPKYIIEFMGFDFPGGDPSNSACDSTNGATSSIEDELNDWPYCSLDRSTYRVTVLATTGNNDETRVMLQSIYVVEN